MDEAVAVERLNRVKRKSAMLADVHGQLASKIDRLDAGLRYSTLLITVALLATTFATGQFVSSTLGVAPSSVIWVRGVTATCNFFMALVVVLWRPTERAQAHRRAVDHYTRVLYRVRDMLAQGALTTEQVTGLETEYLDDQSLPRIPESVFLVCKRRYQIKRVLSEFVEDHPFAWLPWVRLQLFVQALKLGPLPDGHLRRTEVTEMSIPESTCASVAGPEAEG